jgi:hypothetical protein
MLGVVVLVKRGKFIIDVAALSDDCDPCINHCTVDGCHIFVSTTKTGTQIRACPEEIGFWLKGESLEVQIRSNGRRGRMGMDGANPDE